MKALVSIPVKLFAEQFDGTRESAKKVTNWIKSDSNSRYNSAELREQVSKFGFDSNLPYDVNQQQELTIHTDSGRHFLRKGDWLILYVDTGVYSTSTNIRLFENYAEL